MNKHKLTDSLKIGVLLTNLGTPDAPTKAAVKPFLKALLSDPRVVGTPPPRWLWMLILNGIILNIRPKKSAKKYQSIWDTHGEGSPLLAISKKQKSAVKAALNKHSPGRFTVSLGMRYGNPSIASALKESQLIFWIGQNLNLEGISIFLVILLVVGGMVFLTEINSNTASTAIFLPVLAGVSQAGNFHPFLLMIPATIAASCAFMLPSGTGPNAIVLSSGHVSIPVMAKCGFWLNLISIGVIVVLLYFILLPFLGVGDGIPDWM